MRSDCVGPNVPLGKACVEIPEFEIQSAAWPSALYVARCLSVDGATVSIELQIVHPDISSLEPIGCLRKLLHEWVSPADDGTDVELASRYVKSVKLSPLRNAKKNTLAKTSIQ